MAQTKQRTVGLQLTTSNQDIYEVPSRFLSKINSILIANETGADVTVSLDWYKASNTTYYTICEALNVDSNSIIQITDLLYLEPGDKLRGLAGSNSAITISVMTDETFTLSRGI